MKPGIKALLVVFGTMAFFLIPIVGPAASSAGNWLVQRALGVDDESAVMDRKRPGYAGTPLAEALECCTTKCELDWNWNQDRCTLDDRMATQCYETCGKAKTTGGVPPVIVLPRHE